MRRLTRALLVVAVGVGLIGLLPPKGMARPQQQAYAGAALGIAVAHPEAGTGIHRAENRRRRNAHRAIHPKNREARRSHHATKAKQAETHVTTRRRFDQSAARSFGPMSLTYTPDPTLRSPDDRFTFDARASGQSSDGQATDGPSDLFNGPPTSTSIESLGEGHGQRVMVPLFKVLQALSGPQPQ